MQAAWLSRLPVGQWVGAFLLHRLGQSTPSLPRTTHSLTAQRAKSQVTKIYKPDLATRKHNFVQMHPIVQRVLQEIPGTVLAQDSPGRETDIAFDHSVFHHLAPQQIQQVLHLLKQEGMSATVSSIHIDAWSGDHNKLHGAQWLLKELTGRDLKQELDQWVYVGDSTNDQVMFEHFTHSVGVANIRRFENELKHLPQYIASKERGAGFAELANALLQHSN
jgi:hydroxymethylpyrimidine pyrophosphatase-like HAD family hydrolase